MYILGCQLQSKPQDHLDNEFLHMTLRLDKKKLNFVDSGKSIMNDNLSPFGSQQSTEDKKPSELGQFFIPQYRWLLHSSWESQSPSSASQGSSIEQKSTDPRYVAEQQSVCASNPNEYGQLFDPHLRLS